MSAPIVNSIRDNVPELVRVPVKAGQGDCRGCWFDAEHPTLPHHRHRVCGNQGSAITKSRGLGMCYIPGANRHFIFVKKAVVA